MEARRPPEGSHTFGREAVPLFYPLFCGSAVGNGRLPSPVKQTVARVRTRGRRAASAGLEGEAEGWETWEGLASARRGGFRGVPA
jgi:hypothetical protein